MVHREIIQKMVRCAAKAKPFEAIMEKMKIISASNGKLEGEMKIEERHTNIFGTLHGGCTATLVDCVSGYALLTHAQLLDKETLAPRAGQSGVSVDMHLTYIRSAQVGEDILIQANTTKAGKTLTFLKVAILNKQTEDVLAVGSHKKYIAR